jgi:cell division protein FtsA
VVTLPTDREIIHALARHYVVDGQEGIKNPVGMLGHRIEVHTTIVSGTRTSVNNLARCIERAGIGLDSLVLQPMAAGYAVLTEAERDLGVAVLDIGGGTTDVAVFSDGALAFAEVLPVGGFQVSNDIAVGLRAPFSAAEEIKVRHGFAIADLVEDDRQIDVSAFDAGDGRPVYRRTVSEIIEPRMEETLFLAREALERGGFKRLPAGVVLCGGTAQLGGLRRLAGDIFGNPVRVGAPTGVYGLTDQISSPAYATSVGLLRWGLEESYDEIDEGRGAPLAGVGNAIRRWLKNFLP